MKLKKKSGLIGAVIALSAASLVSVGFASWVISQGDTKEVGGTIIVDKVDNNVHKMSIVSGGSGTESFTLDTNIIFGAPKQADLDEYEDTDGVIWLTNDGKLNGVEADSAVEVLSATFVVRVTNIFASTTDTSTIANTITASGFTCSATGFNAQDANDKYYINQNPTFSFSENYTKVADSRDGTVEVTITFAWGDAFNNNNPYFYYNALANNDTNVAAAQEALGAIAAANNGTYSFTLTVA